MDEPKGPERRQESFEFNAANEIRSTDWDRISEHLKNLQLGPLKGIFPVEDTILRNVALIDRSQLSRVGVTEEHWHWIEANFNSILHRDPPTGDEWDAVGRALGPRWSSAISEAALGKILFPQKTAQFENDEELWSNAITTLRDKGVGVFSLEESADMIINMRILFPNRDLEHSIGKDEYKKITDRIWKENLSWIRSDISVEKWTTLAERLTRLKLIFPEKGLPINKQTFERMRSSLENYRRRWDSNDYWAGNAVNSFMTVAAGLNVTSARKVYFTEGGIELTHGSIQ